MQMGLVWLGALLIIGGVVFMAWEGIFKGRFRTETHSFTARGFGFHSNWPGFVMVGLGALAMLAGAAFVSPG
jgi:drug/metabolite transporter (DMT)-like permease